MMYPTLYDVERASLTQLATWYRFLDSPGTVAIVKPHFGDVLEAQTIVLNRITARFEEMGGMTPAISKQIGWN